LLLELGHGDSWQLASSVVLGFVLMDLMDGNCRVYDGRLNGLLLHNRLDVLVHVVMNMLACNCGTGAGCVLGAAYVAGVLELSLLSGKTLLYVVIVAMLDISMLHTSYLVAVLFWEHLTVGDGLY